MQLYGVGRILHSDRVTSWRGIGKISWARAPEQSRRVTTGEGHLDRNGDSSDTGKESGRKIKQPLKEGEESVDSM